jgi:hypothetical protein
MKQLSFFEWLERNKLQEQSEDCQGCDESSCKGMEGCQGGTCDACEYTTQESIINCVEPPCCPIHFEHVKQYLEIKHREQRLL